MLEAADGIVRAGFVFGFVKMLGKGFGEDAVDESGFPGAGNAGEADKEAEGDIGVELVDVVTGGTFNGDFLCSGFAAFFGDGDGFFSGEPREGALFDF